ncbi:hypothetical protein I6G82_02795 [Lysinibacillus macroides]|uniref:PsbP C-terminal domain-containing protein n=1 Tax=Lysinibacillus macroides TaxID=33935 RepID=A0A0N0UWK7_9BACI|nr:hypothetical protein [Lysinibacillus macroides]KOY81265.1 hypothetical protein ADM90_19190 [Lysinibacillus macroides]QPR68576.1 hypothetical protein I6G82_02795 [Lysinibacillus macroides]
MLKKFLSFIFIITFLVACNDDEIKIKSAEWETYLNSKYGFSVNYPPDWHIGEESDNEDGINLYVGNPDVRILTYAAHYMEEISDPYESAKNYGFDIQRITLDNGKSADLILGNLDEKVHYELVFIDNDVIYNINAEVSKSFFEKNEDILLKVIKSLDTL